MVLIYSWIRFNIVLSAVRSTPDVLNLVIFMFTMMIVFSIIGRSIFLESLENPRANFSSFADSFTTLFQVVTGGDPVMFDFTCLWLA